MSLDQRRDLTGRADTQALLGDRVRVVALEDDWARVRVAGQPNPGDVGGYDGWVPRRQLTARSPTRTEYVVTVVARTAWLRTDDTEARRTIEVSYGTRLSSAGTVGKHVRVLGPAGGSRRILARDVVVHRRGTPALVASRASVADSASAFTGLAYLWAGRSGFGLDCSGLTSLVYRVHGVVIPRDAAPQSLAGVHVARDVRVRGDLLFYATSGTVHHVTLYVGGGLMVHAPMTGRDVEVVPVAASGYWTARRHLE
ncbi:MAG TPA: C40 family peptidase [Nocardioidaceae bacterium]|nr:C40 family peptidase [Nocardioidaceae bacterium]